MRDPSSVKAMLARIRAAGPDQLHVIADFDRTLTKATIDGKKVNTAFQCIRDGGYMPEEYTRRGNALYEHYYPIEIDSTLSLEVKKGEMQAWWEQFLSLCVEFKLTRRVLDDIVKEKKVMLRERTSEVFSLLRETPFLIFSAGLGNVITGILDEEKLMHENVHVISNFYTFDTHGRVTGFENQIIHTYNKNEIAIKHTPYYEEVAHRENVILIGDSLGDACMAGGMQHKDVLKVGILYEDRKKLPAYEEAFDIVLMGDDDLGSFLDILQDAGL